MAENIAFDDRMKRVMELVDTHAHLDDEAFAADLDDVVARAAAAGVSLIVTVGTDPESSAQAVALARRHPQVRAAVGIHPHEAGRHAPDAVAGLQDVLRFPEVVAVGETGLDHYRDYAPRAAQAALFRAHLALAAETGHPVIVHCREAHGAVLGVLAEYPGLCVVMHAFSGSLEVARECLRRGYYLSFAGPVTFPNARGLLDVARLVPRDRLLLETDAPYLTPHPHRGHRNEPAFVRLVVERLAALRGEAVERLAEAVLTNARRVFGGVAVTAP